MTFANQDWDFDKLEELIEGRGDKVIHETGISCTCRNEDTLASLQIHEAASAAARRINCDKCQDGFIYRSPKVIMGLLTSIEAGPNRKLIESGYAVQGDAVFSPSLKVFKLTDFDKITFLHSTPVGDGQVIFRNAGQLNDNAGLDTKGLQPDEDRLWYQADCAIHCEDEFGEQYFQDADFVLEDKVIRWVGREPKDKTLYTVKYTAFLEWIVYNTPFERFDRGRPLAQRVLIRKKHVTSMVGSPADTAAKREQEAEGFVTRTTI